MENSRDTICALASGALPAAIAIVRLSGPQTETILKELLGEIPAPRRASLRTLRDEQRAIIDHGLVVWMPGPDSYTGEDSAEFHLHGGVAVVEHVLKTLTAAKGVRLAEPGEFSRRAFEAGRMDLTQAEAVADLIDAESEAQKASALRQLAGERSRIYADWRTRLLRAAALVEAMIDFPDEDDAPDDVELDIRSVLSGVLEDIDAALDDEGLGERLRDGFRIALVGPPNAGKSTLMNALSRRDVSIVTDRPGTTRDLLESRIRIAGAVAWLVDTAGIRETPRLVPGPRVARRPQETPEDQPPPRP
ncbi:MAG: tRNA uridine-5-carboxymethylaminomethyl(34) synthesis GTPase MnmE, partial [Pseudomonadota bacterium]